MCVQDVTKLEDVSNWNETIKSIGTDEVRLQGMLFASCEGEEPPLT